MRGIISLALVCGFSVLLAEAPEFNERGELLFPSDYRDWVFLSSGLGMTYGPAASASPQPLFDNVFVNPAAYRQFKQTGRWPDGAMFILEIRYSTSQGSINRGGHFQTDVAAVEASVKDTKRFPNGWAYFNFRGGFNPVAQTARALDANSSCQGCHKPNGAVDNTFTQFYPAALEIAKKHGTVKADYKPHQPSPVALFHRIRDTQEDAGRALSSVKTADPRSAALSEGNLNRVGHGLLEAGKTSQALAVFTWMVEAYPQSANALDSLAEAQEKAGKIAGCRTTSTRALQLLEAPGNQMDAASRDRLKQSLVSRLERLKGK